MQDNHPRAIVFDAYGTLLDVTAVGSACAQHVAEPNAFVTMWRAKQLEYTWLRSLMGRYEDFEHVTRAALEWTLLRAKVELSPDAISGLMATWLRLEPFDDAVNALRRLAGLRMAVLSNGNLGMLEPALRHAGLRDAFDDVLSVDEVRCFKPDPRVYALATQRLNLQPVDILFVSGNAWDAAGAIAFGFRVAWLQRGGQPFDKLGVVPSLTMSNLSDLAEALGR